MAEAKGTDSYVRGTVSNEEERAFKPLVLMQPDGTIRVYALQVGMDADGAERIFLVDASRLLRNRPYEPYRAQLNGLLGVAWAAIATAPANLEWRCWVTFGIAAGGTDGMIGLRVNTDGATARTIVYFHPLYIHTIGPKFGPITISDGDTIEALRVGGSNMEWHVEYEEYRGDTA